VVISLLLILKRFLRVVRLGWSDLAFRGLSVVLSFWLALGTIIYSLNEGWGMIDSFYFCVMTLTTIGYGDFNPSSEAMRLYTVLYAVLGIGFFVAFNAKIVSVAFESRHDETTDDAESPESAA